MGHLLYPLEEEKEKGKELKYPVDSLFNVSYTQLKLH